MDHNHFAIILNYILEHEAEDFFENPSPYHVFYSALCVDMGVKYAMIQLEIALKAKYE